MSGQFLAMRVDTSRSTIFASRRALNLAVNKQEIVKEFMAAMPNCSPTAAS